MSMVTQFPETPQLHLKPGVTRSIAYDLPVSGYRGRSDVSETMSMNAEVQLPRGENPDRFWKIDCTITTPAGSYTAEGQNYYRGLTLPFDGGRISMTCTNNDAVAMDLYVSLYGGTSVRPVLVR